MPRYRTSSYGGDHPKRAKLIKKLAFEAVKSEKKRLKLFPAGDWAALEEWAATHGIPMGDVVLGVLENQGQKMPAWVTNDKDEGRVVMLVPSN